MYITLVVLKFPINNYALGWFALWQIFKILSIIFVLVLNQGKIAEVGSHAELLRQEGIYHRLHSLQETGELRG